MPQNEHDGTSTTILKILMYRDNKLKIKWGQGDTGDGKKIQLALVLVFCVEGSGYKDFYFVKKEWFRKKWLKPNY